MLEQADRELIEAGRSPVRYFPDARTVDAEVTAAEAAIRLAADTSTAGAHRDHRVPIEYVKQRMSMRLCKSRYSA
jgi:hypothetical protein